MVNNTAHEKKVLLECDHPFIAKMDYLIQDDLRLYFVMPFIRGTDLQKYYKSLKPKRMPESEVKFLITQIVLGVGHLHENMKMAHRDLKLDNILLDEDGYI